MQKNVASQKWIVFAFDRTDNTAKTSDAGNITANLRLDGGGANAVDDTNPTELEDGYYVFDITQAETNADLILISPQSSTGNIQVIGIPGAVYTTPAAFPTLTKGAIINEFETQSQADPTGFHVNVKEVNGTAQTANDNGADINEILTDTGTTLDTLIKDVPTVAEFEARSILAADYVVVGDTIAGVTAVSNDVGITQAGADKVRASVCVTGDPANSIGKILYEIYTNRLTSARAGYLANINNANLATIADISTLTSTEIAYLNASISSRSSHTAANVWAVGTRALTDKAGFSLAAASITAIWEKNISAFTGAGYAGTYVKTLYDDWINAGRLDAILDIIAADVVNIDGDAMRGTDSANTTTPPTVNAIADQVWDEILTGAAHNIATSAGRRLRELSALSLHSGTAQAGTATTITLAAGANGGDGIFNRNLIIIIGGTGAGQTRTIADYNDTTKVCILDRNWRINPDATSEYQILADDTPLVVDQGVAQAGTATTITLRDYASSINDTYLCNIIAIVGGTGRGQARLVGAYNGSTKVITLCGDNWVTNPDNTSVYVMIPYGTTCASCMGTTALTQINTEVDTALNTAIPGSPVADSINERIKAIDILSEASGNGDLAAILVDTNELQTDWANGGRLDLIIDSLAFEATLTAMKGSGFLTGTDSLEAIRNRGDSAWITGGGGSAADIADAVWDELQSGHTDAGSFGKYLDTEVTGVGGIGSGALSCTWTQKDEGGTAMDNVQVWVSTDEAGNNVVAGTLITDASGEVTFMLDAGTYYVWRERGGYNFTNPQTWTVS